MIDPKSKVGKFVDIELIGMDRPYDVQRDDLYRIKDELAEALRLPIKKIGHGFGSINMLQFQWPQEIDPEVIDRGLTAFQQSHPKFKVVISDHPFQWM